MGSFRYAAASDTWRWSDGVFAVHGFGRGEVVPTTALLLAHAHPADRPRAKQRLRECLSGGKIFSFLYRIVDAAGDLRWALLAGEGVFDADGAVTGMRGYLIDLTEPQARARSQEIASATRKAVASRATIEQAKGALMLVYGLDAEAAFALLSWQSQHSNIKLRDLAERLVAAVGGDIHAPSGIRQRLDEIVYSLPDGPAAAIAARGEDSPLAVEQQSRDGAVVLHLSGEIDMATGPRLERSLATALMAAAPPGPLIVDLSGVQHLGSVGIALLTSYHRRCRLSGIGLRVVSGDGPAASVLSIAPTGFELSRNVPEALARPRLEVRDDGAASGR
jgi:anti-anti-sigma factor